MTAFIFSIVVSLVLGGIVVEIARRRPPGTRLTWGEAFLAGAFVFLLLLMIYGVVPDRWLRWADGELKWRKDKIGIPMGPLGHFLHNQWGIGSKGVIAPNGIKFGGRGKIVITANAIEDVVVTVIYGVGITAQIIMWRWWQQRGKRAEQPAIEKKSAYGRPLVRST